MINVVMIARDRPRLTRQAIHSLLDNTTQNEISLAVLDDGSQEPVTGFFPVRYDRPGRTITEVHRVDDTTHVLGALKNQAIRISRTRGDWLYLSDNDAYFTPGWDVILTDCLAALEPEFKLLGGQNHPYHTPISERKAAGRIVYAANALAGTSWLMRWETWDRFGPLVETGAPGVCQSEDHAFSQKIREAGFKVGSVWPPVVYDCGITQTDGNKSPGWEVKVAQRVAGVIYE